MALFGKKKDAEIPASPGSAHFGGKETSFASKDEAAFDFDAIARDLESQDGVSAFDRLLSQPVPTDAENSDEKTGELNLDEAFLSDLESAAPFSKRPSPPPAPVVEAAPPPEPAFAPTPAAAIASSAPVATEPKRKKSPVLLGGGVIAILALLGGGAYFAVSQQMTPAEDETPVATLPVRPSAPVKPAALAQDEAKPPVAVADDSVPVTPAIKAQLRQLWEQGKAAKAKGDYAGARSYWEQALQLQPGHPGFQESIDKLPQ